MFMADPLVIVAELLAPAFASVAGTADGIDPVVRPSDRADAQANGALALAKQLGRSERSLHRWELQKIGPPVIRVEKLVLYRKDAVEQWLRKNERK